MCYKFYIFWDGPHTHPATKKGRVWGGHPNTSKTRSTGNPKETQPPSPRKKDKGGGKPRGSQNHHGTVSLSWTCAGWLKGSRPCSIQVRLVTAVSFTSNWCTSVPYQQPKRRSQACKPDTFTNLSVAYVLHGAVGQLEVSMFQHFTTFDSIHLNRIQEGRTQREEGEEAIELIQPASVWEVKECTSEMANRPAGP